MNNIADIRNPIPFLGGNAQQISSKEKLEQNQKDIVQLAEEGNRVLGESFTGEKCANAKKYMEKIKKISLDENAKIIADTALRAPKIEGVMEGKTGAFWGAFAALKSGSPLSIGPVLSDMGMKMISGESSLENDRVTRIYFQEISKHSQNKTEVALADAALTMRRGRLSHPSFGPHYLIFDKIIGGTKGPAALSLTDVGLDVALNYMDYGMRDIILDKENMGIALLKAIMKNSAKDSEETEIAGTVLASLAKDPGGPYVEMGFEKIAESLLSDIAQNSPEKTDAALAKAALAVTDDTQYKMRIWAFKVALEKIDAGVKVPVAIALSDAGRAVMGRCPGVASTQKAGKVFLQAIFENAVNEPGMESVARKARKALNNNVNGSARSAYDERAAYKSAFEEISNGYYHKGDARYPQGGDDELPEDQSGIVDEIFQNNGEGKGNDPFAAENTITVRENEVVIGGITLEKKKRS